MSQGQPRRPQPGGQDLPRRQQWEQEPIKYGDVFNVSGDLAGRTVAPEDANMMQSAESKVLGQTQKGGPAATMQSAAIRNERAGFVGHDEASDAAGDQGVTVTETDIPGARIVTERVAGQVVGQFAEATLERNTTTAAGVVQSAITIGDALEPAAQTAGNKPGSQSDAAAVHAAEVRAISSSVVIPGGLAASAQSAANYNAAILARDEEKIKLCDVLRGATTKLPADKVVTRSDAEGVSSAEMRNNPSLTAHPGGIAASITAAAWLNEDNNVWQT